MKIPVISKWLEHRYSLKDLDKAMDLLITGQPTATGVNVTNSKALQCIAYFDGVRLISETCGQLPLIEYRRLSRGKERATDRAVYRLLHDEPNPEMDAMSFKTTLTSHAVTWGNGFAEIQWDDNGIPKALWPLRPDKMKVGRDSETKEIIYVYTLPDGTIAKLPAYRIFHLPGFSFDGLIGYDPVYLAREAIGMALALEEFGGRFFGNGATPGGVLEHPHALSQEAKENLRKSWAEMHQGLSNQHRLAILQEGMTFKQIGIPNNNAQYLESRVFQIQEIARILHIPPHMLGELSRGTFSNIEHQGIEFVQYTMTPWFKRWEGTSTRKLLLPTEKSIYFIEFLVDALLRGDSTARSAFYRELFYLGALSPNDIREKENMNPIRDPGGDKYYVQANMVPMEAAGQQAQMQQQSPKSLNDAVKRISERNKQNILRAYEKDPDGLPAYLDDYSRDFQRYMFKEITDQ